MEFEKPENENQKGGSLEGGALNDEVMASSDSVHEKGLQQFYTPPEAAALVAAVIGKDTPVLDLTAGDGSLIQNFDTPRRFGVEIDPDQIANATEADRPYTAIQGDIQHVYTLLRNAGPSWESIAINPPFGLRWSDPTFKDGKEVNSTLLTLVYATRLLAHNGQIVLIAGKGRFYREILNHEVAKDLFYAVIECDDLFAGTREPAVIAFGMSPEIRKVGSEGVQMRALPRDMLDLAADWVKGCRAESISPYTSVASGGWYAHQYTESFKVIQTEYDRRTEKRVKKDRAYDAMFSEEGKLQFLPSAYAIEALKKQDAYNELRYLNGQSVNYFIQAERLWLKMVGFEEAGILTIEPRLKAAVDEAVGEVRKTLIPLYDIKPQQALGFLVDLETIKCTKDDVEGKFVKGEFYRVQCKTKTVVESENRVVASKKNPGEYTNKTFKIQKKVLEIMLWGNGAHKVIQDGGERASENIKWLVDHFDIPNPGSVATKHPDEIAAIEEKVQVVLDTFLENSRKYEKKHTSITPYSHRPFQKRDIARLLFKGSGLLSWEQGLGKTLGGLLFFEATKQVYGSQDALLIVTAKDLVPQWIRECERFLGRKPVLIKTHAEAKKIAKHLRMGGQGIYITYYEALSIVGTRNKNNLLPVVTVREWQEDRLIKGTDKYGRFYFDDEYQDETGMYLSDEEGNYIRDEQGNYQVRKQVLLLDGEAAPEGKTSRYGYVRPQYEKITKRLTSRDLCPQCEADTRSGWTGVYCEAKNAAGDLCGYTHYAVRMKPIASFLSTAFRRGTIVLDEITLIQGQYSKRSIALRGLRARHKLGMTGTPIKNFIGQAFWLLWWCLGNGSRRFPYEYESGYLTFESDFSVVEWQMNGSRKQQRKALPEITNLSKLWRLLASSIIRRRKEETGENLVPVFYHEMRVPMGHAQAEQIDSWLKNFHEFFKEKYPEAPIVKAGMHKIMAPMLGLNWKLDYSCTVPESDPDFKWTGVDGVSNWTPANLRVVELSMALAKQGRKVLIGSNLVSTSEWIANQLTLKGVKAEHILDGDGVTVNPEERAKRVYSFQTDDVQVFAAGVNAIRLGHNLDAADAVIMHGLDWSFDTLDQFIARVHRLTSKNPIDVFVVLPALEGQETITTRKWSMLEMKTDSIDLALDGRLIPKREQQITEAEVIRELMERGIRVTDECVDEVSIYEAWETVPPLDEFEVLEGMIPARPEVEVEAEIEVSEKTQHEAAEAVGSFLAAFYVAPAEQEEEETFDHDEAEAEYEDEDYSLVTLDTSESDLVPAEVEAVSIETPEATAPVQEEEAGSDGTLWSDSEPVTPSPGQSEIPPALPTVEAGAEVTESSTLLPPPALDIMGQIREAKELHAEGILTDAEFAEAKADLLALLKASRDA